MGNYITYHFDKDGIYRCDKCGQPYEPGHSLYCSKKLKQRKTKEELKAEEEARFFHIENVSERDEKRQLS